MKKLAVLISIIWALTSWAQDPTVSQMLIAKPFYNPAYITNVKELNFTSINRAQWINTPKAYNSNYIFGGVGCRNHPFSIGFSMLNINQGEGVLRTQSGTLIFGSNFPIFAQKSLPGGNKSKFRKKYSLSFSSALAAGLARKTINWSDLVFSDQIDPIYGTVYTTNAYPQYTNSQPIAEINAGGLLRLTSFRDRKKELITIYTIGYAAYHMGKQNETFLGGDAALPFKQNFNFGYLRTFRNQNFYNANFILSSQAQHLTLVVGNSVSYQNTAIFGANLRFSNNVNFKLGIEALILEFSFLRRSIDYCLSYDITFSRLGVVKSYGSIDLGLKYTIDNAYVFCGKIMKKSGAKMIFDNPLTEPCEEEELDVKDHKKVMFKKKGEDFSVNRKEKNIYRRNHKYKIGGYMY